jgi:DNA mismatch repair protein MutL
LYERFLDCLSNNRAVSQADMFPVTSELNPSDYFILKEIEDELELLGFSIQHLENNKIIIKGRPAGSDSSDPVEMLEIILEEYKNTHDDPATGAKEKIAAAMAGASAIPYGKGLVHNEMENLFDSLFACQAANFSPKGKPVISIITLEEIDKKFN